MQNNPLTYCFSWAGDLPLRIQLSVKEENMARNTLALLDAGKPETLSFRNLVVKRLVQAALVAIVLLASFLTGTIISSILLTGIEL
jgi:hypothetical protein